MSARPPNPLSHHDLLQHLPPFSARGWQPDLADTDLAGGRVRFVHPGAPAGTRLDLQCDEAAADPSRRVTLTRRDRLGAAQTALESTLVLQAPDVGRALARLDTLPLATGWRHGPGWVAALDREGRDGRRLRTLQATQRIEPDSRDAHDGAAAGCLLQWRPAGRSARLQITAPPHWPDDLLAVLGWRWSPWRRRGGGWVGSVRLAAASGRGAGAALEARLAEAGAHLAATLAAAPAAFHARHAAARWRVTLRRAVPLALAWALLALVAAAPWLRDARDTAAPLVALLLPPLLLAGYASAAEGARLEWPLAPRPLVHPAW